MEALTLSSTLISNLNERLTTALSALVNKPVHLSIDHHGVLEIPKIHAQVNQMSGYVTTVYIPVTGEVSGDIFLFLPGETANYIADLMTGNPIGTTKIIGEFETSALKEMGNITSGVVITQLANSLAISMMLTIPNIATDMPGALVDQVLIQYGEVSNDLLAISLSFSLDDIEEKGSFLLLFDQESSETIRKKMEKAETEQ